MANSRKLIVEVVGDDSKLQRTLKRSETATTRFAKRLEGASAGAALSGRGGLAGSAALLRGGGFALGAGFAAKKASELATAASDLNEQMSKSRAVFGQSSSAVEQWSQTTAQALGLSQTQALEASGTFGNLFNTVGISGELGAQLSRTLVTLASDLASFNNTDPTEALDALRSGLIGEAEPLRRFGVLLSETRVQQQALADTGKTNVKALTDQEKAFARYEIILNDTKTAQGDFSRTSGGLANQQRKLRAQTADLEARIGTGLLPLMTTAVTQANEFADAAENLGSALGSIGLNADRFGKIVEASFLVNPATGPLIASTKVVNKLFGDGEKQASAFAGAAAKLRAELEGVAASLSAEALLHSNRPEEGAGLLSIAAAAARPDPKRLTAEQRNQFFDQAVSRSVFRAQDDNAAKELAALKKVEQQIVARIAVTKDVTRKLKLEDDLISVQRLQRQASERIQQAEEAKLAAQQQARLDARQRAEEKRLRAQEAQRKKIAQRTARQFRTLGLDATGEEVTPGVENLKKRLGTITDAVKGTSLNTPRLQSQLARFRKVLSEGLVPKDVRAKIKEMFDDINAELGKGAKEGGPLTKTTALSADRILQGLGLGRDAERELRARLSSFNSAGTALAGAGGGGGTTAVTVPVTVTVDGKAVATASAKYEGRAKRVNTIQRNGPTAGW